MHKHMWATMLRQEAFTWRIGLDWTGDLVQAMVKIHPFQIIRPGFRTPQKKESKPHWPSGPASFVWLFAWKKSRGFLGKEIFSRHFLAKDAMGLISKGASGTANGNCWRSFPTYNFPTILFSVANPELQICEISPLIFGPGKISKSAPCFCWQINWVITYW